MTTVLLCLHGSGDTGPGLRRWMSALLPDFETTFEKRGVSIIFPSAKEIPYTMNGGEKQRVWFDRIGLTYSSPEDAVGVRRSASEIERMVRHAERVIVLGFSQGGCMALHVGFHPNFRQKISSIVCMSSFLYESSELYDEIARASKKERMPPVMIAHGLDDRLIPLAFAKETARRLSVHVDRVTFLPLPGVEHEMTRTELEQARDFIFANLTAGGADSRTTL